MTPNRARIAVVTGGASGIGWAIASRLAAEGWTTVAADINPGETARVATGVVYRNLDIRDRDQVDQVFTDIRSSEGGLDLLVDNAGIQIHGRTETLSWETWSAVVDVNLHGTFNCLQAAGRIMLADGAGSIVNIASVAAARGAPGRAPYAATKAAIVSLTRTAAVEWAEPGRAGKRGRTGLRRHRGVPGRPCQRGAGRSRGDGPDTDAAGRRQRRDCGHRQLPRVSPERPTSPARCCTPTAGS